MSQTCASSSLSIKILILENLLQTRILHFKGGCISRAMKSKEACSAFQNQEASNYLPFHALHLMKREWQGKTYVNVSAQIRE